MESTCPARTFSVGSNLLPFANPVNPLNIAGASLPLLFSLLGEDKSLVDGFITSISVGSSYNWYFALTQFESIFLGLIFLQIVVLRYLEILPLNLNNWLVGDPSGKRRKRRSLSSESLLIDCHKKDFLAESAFVLLRKLDDQECLLRALCVVQSASVKGHPIPKKTKGLLSALKMSSRRRMTADESNTFTKTPTGCMGTAKQAIRDEENTDDDNDSSTARPEAGIKVFEDAVMAGIEDSKGYQDLNAKLYLNSTETPEVGVCALRYKSCSLSTADIIHYFDTISNAGMI